MQHCLYHPAAPLDEFVDFFWVIADGETDRKERILPSGTSELVINLYENEIRIYDSMQPEQYRRLSGAVVSGTYSRTFICDARQHRSMLGVHFRPGGAFPFLQAPATELSDIHANLEDLWGSAAREIRARLCEATTARQRFQLMEEALLQRARRFPGRHPAIDVALRLVGPVGTGSSTRDLARKAGMSQRHLIHLFARDVGLTPKRLGRILRFQHARTLSEEAGMRGLARPEQHPSNPPIDWAEIATVCGYYDQSHLIGDFQELSGLSPSEYIRRLLPARNLKDNHLPSR